MPPQIVRIEGLDALVKKIKTIEEARFLIAGMKAGALHMKGKVAEYPPATEANDPSKPRWYVRGWGPKWRVKSGDIHGRHTSETLGRKWSTRSSRAGLAWTIGNNVSYGPAVQDEEKQAKFHKERGWKTTAGVVRDEAGRVLQYLQDELKKVLKS